MKLDDLKMKELVPGFMKQDKAIQGLCRFFDTNVRELKKQIDKLAIWNHIDEMTEEQLDEIAKDMNISWYLYSAEIEQKKKIIKEYKEIARKKGTKWAVETVTSIYFENISVMEWWEYGGEPGHFKIQASNKKVKYEKNENFIKILNTVKKESAILDSIELVERGTDDIFLYTAYQEIEIMKRNAITR